MDQSCSSSSLNVLSSPTIRSSIHSLSSCDDHYIDLEEQKKHKNPPSSSSKSCFSSSRLITTLLLLCFYTLFAFFNLPISPNLVLLTVFVAILLFLGGNKLYIFSQIWFNKETNQHPVEWSIGHTNSRDQISTIISDGVELYNNGDFYEGEFHKGRCNGSGVYNYFVNGRYEGDWVDGRYDGHGIETWARGSRHRGQYRQGLRHGYGVYNFYTGDTYVGEWSNGQSHGIGLQTCFDGSCYIGQFKAAVKHGFGVYYFRNGDQYAGEYFGDKVHGFGVYNFANGHCYEGSWHEGRKQGYGMYTFRNGDIRCGEWDWGNLKAPLPPQNDAVIQVVEIARKTAENAINIRRVDKQVNNAVMAANRAATAGRVAAIKAVQNRMDGKVYDTYN